MNRLNAVLERLSCQYDPRPIPTDPLQLILWENIGYLIEDQRRIDLFDRFALNVGLEAAVIAAAEDETLFAIAEHGGMRPAVRVERWRTIAAIVLEVGGDLRAALTALPLAKARTLLKRFPAIGDPGADKILLFSGIAVRPCLESNGLRVLARLGFFDEQLTYNASYKAAVGVLEAQVGAKDVELKSGHILLREHGKLLCRRGEPLCGPCALEASCPKIKVKQL